jgi:predicted DNA-binding transcriptional regulator AlpA
MNMHSPATAIAARTPEIAAQDKGLSPEISPGEVLIGSRRYVTTYRLASMLGMSPRTINRWNTARMGPPRIRVGMLILFEVTKVQDWLASFENEPVASRRTS